MRHFKFVGGPWDGQYHEIDTDRMDYVDVRVPPPFSYKMEPFEEPVLDEEGEPVLDEEGEPVMKMIPPKPGEFTQYTLRHWASIDGSLYWYAPDNWTDMYTLSQLVHHYPGNQ